tara:strand:+ start:15426 stop:15806 length:381 start_codon:yes stop_codon:yes gene_type:complete
MDIGTKLRIAREEKRFSQNEVAEILGISQKTLSNIESGKSSLTINHLVIFCDIFKLNVLDLLQLADYDKMLNPIKKEQNPKPNELIQMQQKLIIEKDLRIKLLEEFNSQLMTTLNNGWRNLGSTSY